MRASRSAPSRGRAGSAAGDRGRAGERLAVGVVVSSLDVERLGAVGEGVHGSSGGLAGRQRQREVDVVEDRAHVRAAATGLDAPGLVAHAVSARPLGAASTSSESRARRALSAAETALAVSIALPPPTATRPSQSSAAATAAATESRGTCPRTPSKVFAAASPRPVQRGVVMRSGRSKPSSASSAGYASSPQRTITSRAPGRSRGTPRRRG